METLVIRLALAACIPAGRRVYLAELHELIVFLASYFRNEGALMADILRLGALPVASVAHFAYEAEPLRAAGKTANERGRTFVLAASNLNSCACCHVAVL